MIPFLKDALLFLKNYICTINIQNMKLLLLAIALLFFVVCHSQNVGIGTTTPTQKLDVRGTTPDDGVLISVGNADASHQLGLYGGRLNDPNPFIIWKAGDPLRFVTDYNGFSELMRIMPNGNVGIGTTNPIARLQVTDSAVLFSGPVTVPATTSYYPPASGAGSRMMWYPEKAAFRVGAVDDTQWDKDNIGLYSFSSGYNTRSIGLISTSMGYYSTARGDYSTSMGYAAQAWGLGSTSMGVGTNAIGNYSTSMGFNTIARGSYSTSIGYLTSAKGLNSISMGYYTNAEGGNSTSMGDSTTASGLASTSMGNNTTASGDYSTSMGDSTTASGLASTSMGNNTTSSGSNSASMGSATIAKSVNSLVIGQYNDTTNTNRLFEIGNGTSNNLRLNALTVLKNGRIGIGITNPIFPLSFAPFLGEKISLYSGGAGEVGIGVYGNELRLHADNPGAKVSFGTQTNAGVFTEAGKFEINGGYALTVFGNIWANGTTYASDERFKQNITAIATPLEKLLQINGVEYEMKTAVFAKNHFSPGRQIGLLAQNVEKIVPEAVHEIDGYKGVDYARLVPLLIESIKEENKKIEDQQKQIDEQRKMIQQLLKK
jgi:hypothetical protein